MDPLKNDSVRARRYAVNALVSRLAPTFKLTSTRTASRAGADEVAGARVGSAPVTIGTGGPSGFVQPLNSSTVTTIAATTPRVTAA